MSWWIAIATAFAFWAYWPRLVDRIRQDSPQQEDTHDHSRTGTDDG